MAEGKRKPRGFEKFDELARKLVQVPREEVEKRLAKRKAKRAKK